MPITLVGSAGPTGANNGGTVARSLPGSLQQGDIVIVGWANSATSNYAFAAPSGWALAATDLYCNGATYDVNLAAIYKIMGAVPDTTVSLPGPGGASFANIGGAMAFRGVDQTTPFDVVETNVLNTGSTAIDPAAITPGTTGAGIVAIGAASTGSGATPGNPGDAANFIGLNHAETNDISLGMAFYSGWTSGAFNPAAWTGGGGAGSSAALTLALRPAPLGGKIKVWNGSAWVEKPAKVWNGSAWVEKPLKVWNGSAWVLI